MNGFGWRGWWFDLIVALFVALVAVVGGSYVVGRIITGHWMLPW